MLMKSFAPSASLVNRVLASGFVLAGLSFIGLQAASAQSITIDFRFDPTDSGFNAASPNIINPKANTDYTVDVFVTVFGDAAHTDANGYGLNAALIRGFSQAIGGGAPAAAFSGGTMGVTSTAPFFAATSPFTSGQVTAPSTGDVGSTTAGTSAVATLDSIADFGARANNSTSLNMNNGNSSVMAGAGSGTLGAGANTGGWTFELAQFVFHTGNTLGASGAETDFWPTRVAGTTTAASITVDGNSTHTVNVASTSETIGTPLRFVVAQAAGTTISVTPGPNASVLKGGSVGVGATLNNTGSTDLNGGDYTFTASGGTNIGYSAAAPSTATTGITHGTGQAFSFTASTAAGPGGTPIGLATVSFTGANAGGGTKITNGPQSGSLSLNVGGATADNSNAAGVYGPALTAPVAAGGSYAGLESAVVAVQGTGGSNASNNASPYLGGHATILAGSNSGAVGRTVSEAWRTRLVPSESPGTRPPLPVGTTTPLSSDVLNLTGLETGGNTTDPYVLDMSYNPTFLPKGGTPAIEQSLANNKLIYMVSPTAADGSPYVNTVLLNVLNQVGPTDPRFGFQGSYSAFVAAFGPGLAPNMGAWGVDIGSHEVWAVLDHNSTFAVIPEPSSILLAGLGLLGLVGLRRRINKVA
jgi:hypothetical protein